MVKQMNDAESVLINNYKIYIEDIVSFNVVEKTYLNIEIMGSSDSLYYIVFQFNSEDDLYDITNQLRWRIRNSLRSRCNNERYLITTEIIPVGFHNLEEVERTIALNPEFKKREIIKHILMPKKPNVPIPPPPAQINETQPKTYSLIDSLRKFFS